MLDRLLYKADRMILRVIVARAKQKPGFIERLREIDGTAFALRIGRRSVAHHFVVENGLLKESDEIGSEPEFVLEGSWPVFWAIARRRLDSDAAFFKRKLSISGIPKKALILKNIYDSL